MPGPKFVLVSLADQANDRGACWPSIPQIASRCGMSERSVSRHLQSLESQNIIRREFVAGRGTKIWLVFATENDSPTHDKLSPPPDTVSSPTPDTVSPPHDNLSGVGMTNCHHPLTPCHPTPDTVSSKPSITINNHQERERSRNATHANQTQVPDDFFPDKQSTLMAKNAGVDLAYELEKFKLHYQANGEYRADWNAQFRKWLLHAQQHLADASKRHGHAANQPVCNPALMPPGLKMSSHGAYT